MARIMFRVRARVRVRARTRVMLRAKVMLNCMNCYIIACPEDIFVRT